MRILYLYTGVMPYMIPVFKEFVQKYMADLHIVYWDQKILTPYKPPKLKNVIYYNRSEFNKNQLLKLTSEIQPDIIYVSGWMDKDYLAVVKKYKKMGIPTVSGFDDQWLGTWRQRVGSLIFPFYFRKYFSHAWINGPRQYEFVKRMGFKDQEIIFNLYTCNTDLFNKANDYIELKSKDYPKTFLYVGNFKLIKGTDILLKAFEIYKSKYQGNWKLICIGNGELKYLMDDNPEVEVMDFLSQEEIVEITRRAGVFILPSRLDMWGVVVHEFSSAGMPLILSENVGAKSTFLIENFNGLSYKNNSAENLAKAMYSISTLTDSELVEMSKNSFLLSNRIKPEMAAASFLSILSLRIVDQPD